jgi:hypothetical protein
MLIAVYILIYQYAFYVTGSLWYSFVGLMFSTLLFMLFGVSPHRQDCE